MSKTINTTSENIQNIIKVAINGKEDEIKLLREKIDYLEKRNNKDHYVFLDRLESQLSEYKEKLKAEIDKIKDRTSDPDDGVANGYNIGLSKVLTLIDKI